MPYKTTDNLPPNIKNHLPKRAQTIYLKAFNNAWDRYKASSRDESLPHKIAWAAVKKTYYKNEKGKWVKKGSQVKKD